MNGLNQVAVIVVTFNSAHCVPALAACLAGYPHVIVVDNGSADDTLSQVATGLPQAKCFALPENIGFGSANNVGLRYIAERNLAPFALLLNPDCTISPENVAQLLATAHAQPQAALIAPLLLDAAGRAQHTYRLDSHRFPHKPTLNQIDGALCVGFLTGACWLLRVAPTLSLAGSGGFDERIFLYYEDDDLCLRLAQAGHTLILDPAATATHASRGSVKMKAGVFGGLVSNFKGEYIRGYHHTRAKLYFLGKWRGQSVARRKRWRLLAVTTLFLVPLRAVGSVLTLNTRYLGRACGRLMALVGKGIVACDTAK